MGLSARKDGLLFKLETTAGTDSVPTPAVNAILFTDELNLTAMEIDYEDRGLIRPYLGNSEQIATATRSRLGFGVEMVGGVAAGDVPGWGPLIEACGFGVVDGASDVVYTPVSSGFKTASIYAYKDSLRHRLLGSMGSFGFTMSARSVPRFNFEFVGKYDPETDSPLVGPVYTAFQTPQPANSTNTTATLDGVSICVENLEVDMGINAQFIERIGCSTSSITERAPTGSLSFEAQPVATKNWEALVLNSTSVPLVINHGTVVGRRLQITMPKVQLLSPAFANQDNELFRTFSLRINPNTGNDEITIRIW